MIKVLFVCLGNICRSPMAQFVFKQMVAEKGWIDRFEIDSAATEGYNEMCHAGIFMLLNVLPVTLFRIYDKTQSAWIVWNIYNGLTAALFGLRVKTDSFIFQFLGLLSIR